MSEKDAPEAAHDLASNVVSELELAGFEGACEIGRGGFGIVYRCTQPRLDRAVAVKVLTASGGSDNGARFVREQHAMGRLTGHPNIVNVLHVGTTASGRPYIVMQYHPSGSLEDRIRRTGPVPLAEACRLGVKMAGALASAHRVGVLHRDVKPANILFTEYGEPALTDFGIAHMSGGFETSTGTVTGSPAFTAPEVLSGEPSNVAADIYGLGATVFCAVTGHAAFQRRSGEDVIAQFLRITTQPIPNLRELGIPEDMSSAIELAMSADPQRRPESAGDFGDELRRIQARHGFPVDKMAAPVPESAKMEREESYLNWIERPANITEMGEFDTGALRNAGAGNASAASGAAGFGVGRLPLDLTNFVGRRRELTETKAQVANSRLVVLTGIGGVGKTRLAFRVASDLTHRFDDGVAVVELGDLQDGSLLVDLVASSLGIRDRTHTQLAGVVTDLLASKNLLLVLDNCEHLLGEAATLVKTLLKTCSELHILATSREPLGISGESVLRVPPLTMPAPNDEPSLRASSRYDALKLFTERAAAAVPGFELTEDNVVAVSQLCRRLDGLPLPIELAAARLRSMSIEQVLERLTDRFTLLTLGSRTAPTRQQTSRLCIDWSYELCTADEQQLWTQLSVFAGSFELDAVEGLCGGERELGALLDDLASLVDKSILIREESGPIVRFRMLELLKGYGRDKAEESGLYEFYRRRHQRWYRELVTEAESEWISPKQIQWIARLTREQPNLREAIDLSVNAPEETPDGLQIAAALFPFWLAKGLFSEGRHWLDRVLAVSLRTPTIEGVKSLVAGCILALSQGDSETAAKLLQEAETHSKQIADSTTNARIRQAEGSLALFRRDATLACRHLRQALDTIGPDGDLALRIWTLNSLGMAYETNGDTEHSIDCYEQVLAITSQHGESIHRTHALRSMGVSIWQQRDFGRASSLVRQALEIATNIDEPFTAALCLEVLAWIACSEQDHRRAAVLMAVAEKLVITLNSSTFLFPTLVTYHQQCTEQTHQALGNKAFAAAQKQGRSLSFVEATSIALQQNSHIPRPKLSTTLTKREQQVAELVAQGMTNRSIAADLVISVRTAQGHVEHILTKLGFISRSQIAAWIVEQDQQRT